MCLKNIHYSKMQFKVSNGDFYAEKRDLKDMAL